MRNLFLLGIWFLPTALNALPDCRPDMEPSSDNYDCYVKIKSLHPTQFAVGLRVVKQKKADLNEMSSEKFEKYLKKHPVPVVIGPGGKFYLTDHHHLCSALHLLDKERVFAKIIKNWSDKSPAEFWKKMIDSNFPEKARYVWLFDKEGKGPQRPDQLPESIARLVENDDPYRSLADDVQEAGHIDKVDGVYFLEFKWGNFFRPRVKVGTTEADFKQAVAKAIPLSHSEAAKEMPGYKKAKN